VCPGIGPPSGTRDQFSCIFPWNYLWQLPVCYYGVISLTIGRVCNLQLLLGLASAVFIGSESCGTHGHILLPQCWDSSNLEGQVTEFITPRHTVAQLYPQIKVEVKLHLRPTVSWSWCGAPIWSPRPGFCFLSESCGFLDVGRSGIHGNVCWPLLSTETRQNRVGYQKLISLSVATGTYCSQRKLDLCW
jgi:hypothetical protein